MKIFRYETTDSTNERARAYAEEGGDAAIFIARSQTAGRGRRGRSFLSPEGAGLYISFLSRPERFDPVATTVFAAVATARAIERVSGASPGIKWVNDLYLGGKKIAGILAEGKAAAPDAPGYLVVGIGVDLLKTGLPPELRGTVGSIEEATGKKITPEELEKALVEEMAKTPDETTMDEYRRRSFLVGKTVDVHRVGREVCTAEVRGISDTGGLLLRFSDGKTEELQTGEVSVRLQNTKGKEDRE